MNSTENLLRAAVANPNLTSIRVEKTYGAEARFFTVYRVELPLPDFNGVPNEWLFAIQDRGRSQGVSRENLLNEVRAFLREIPRSERVVFVSDDPIAHLGDEFDGEQRDVYCLDALEFPREEQFTQPRLAPFVGSVRRKVLSNPRMVLLASPYQRAKPVSGWRFFGRKKQVDQIVGTDENYMIVGARRVGKTSLMREAYRRLQENGENAHFIDVQNCRTIGDVTREILHQVSIRDLAKSIRHGDLLRESVLSNMLRKITSGKKRTTLFLDELGNVIANARPENWEFLGLLRKFSQTGRLRIVFSCFQEVFMRQQKEFTGPLINFTNTMRLRVFNRKEVEDFVLAPLRFWKNLADHEERALVDVVVSRVGTHPFMLQYFCSSFFQKIAEETASGTTRLELAQQANAMFNANLIESFETAVDELFFRIPSPLLQYLFLRRCRDAEIKNERLDVVDFNESWLQSALLELGYQGSYSSHRTILEALEMHSLCSAATDQDKRMMIAAPVIYYYVQKTVPLIDQMLKKLAEDVRKENDLYGIVPVQSAGPTH